MGEPQHQDLLEKGTLLDHFRVIRFVACGGFGEVYAARDTQLGRKVAIKLINPRHLGSDRAAERFLFEARATAQCSHPNIVSVYGVGEYQDRPYVALEFLEGQSLRKRMEEGPGLKEALRYGQAIALALQEAHRRSIVHRDLKPENMLIPRDGRLRLVDFGLARPIGSRDLSPILEELSAESTGDLLVSSYETADRIRGTPGYMSPEQWMGRELTGATDVWALGVILFELVTGHLPYKEPSVIKQGRKVCDPDPAPRVEDGPRALVDLIASCLEKFAEDRPSAADVAEELEHLIHEKRPIEEDGQSPYRGLLSFSEQHAHLFFGRDEDIAAFLERLRREVILPVIGPSGVGKSSFVEAGVIPRLSEQGDWTVIAMRPGREPVAKLAGRIIAARGTPQSKKGTLAVELMEKPQLLGLLLQEIAEQNKNRVLLFIDQLEELQTHTTDSNEGRIRRRFMQAICNAADDPQDPVRVIFTLRDDFLGRMAEGQGVSEALSRVTVLKNPRERALLQTLTKPAEALGYRFDEPELVQEMVHAVRGEPACLPLLQFTARMLWDRRDDVKRVMRKRDYEMIGGVAGALAEHADGVLQGMSPHQVRIAKEILLRLLTPEGTRKVLSRARSMDGLGEEAEGVMRRLIQARLISVRKSQAEIEAEAEVEIVHESLAKTWGRLATWLEEDQKERAFIAQLNQAAELWEKRGRPREEVWSGESLRDVEQKIARLACNPPRRAMRFLEACRDQERRFQRKRRGSLAAVFLGLSLLAAGGMALAYAFADKEEEALRQKEAAEKRGRQAKERWADAQREAARAAFLRGNLVETRAKLRSSLETVDSATARALWRSLSTEPMVWKRSLGGAVSDVAFSPDGRTIALAAQDKTIFLFDVDTSKARFLRGHRDQVFSVAFSPDGRRLISGTRSGDVGLWDLQSGNLVQLGLHPAKVYRVAFSADGQWGASASYDHSVQIWSAEDGQVRQALRGHGDRVFGVDFSPDGRLIATACGDERVRLFDVSSGKIVATLEGHRGRVFAVAFNPLGTHVASGGADQTIRLWDLETKKEERRLSGHSKEVHTIAFGHKNDLASGGYDGEIFIWDLSTGQPRERLLGHQERVYRVAWSPEGRYLVSGSLDRTLRLWRTGALSSPRSASGHRERVFGVAFSPDGSRLASGGWDKTIRLWNSKNGTVERVFEGHEAGVFSVDFSPDGALLASGSWDKTVRLWRVADGGLLQVLDGHRAEVSAVAFSPDGRRLASASWDNRIHLWDVKSGRLVKTAVGHEGPVYDLSWGTKGSRLASASGDGTVGLWSGDGRLLRRLWGHVGSVYGVDFSSNGALVSGGKDGTVRQWNLTSGNSKTIDTFNGRVYHLDLHPGGAMIGVPTSSGDAFLRTNGKQKQITLSGHRADVNYLRFSPTGDLAATTSDDGTVRVWRAATGNLHWRAPVLEIDEKRTDAKWSSAMRRARLVSVSKDGKTMAVLSERVHEPGEVLSLYDVAADTRVFQEAVRDVERMIAMPDGCVTRNRSGRIDLYGRAGQPRMISPTASAVGYSRGRLLLAEGRSVRIYDRFGDKIESHDADFGITAVSLTADFLVLGFEDGNLSLVPLEGSERSPPEASFARQPRSAVVSILNDPPHLLVLGHEDGEVHVLSLDDGTVLAQEKLHGPIVNLLLQEGGVLRAATSLGDVAVLDLGVFLLDYCLLLTEVWKTCPVAWSGGIAVPQRPPRQHRCYPVFAAQR